MMFMGDLKLFAKIKLEILVQMSEFLDKTLKWDFKSKYVRC